MFVVTGTISRYFETITNAVDYDYSHRYNPNSEHKSVSYSVELITNEGKKIWFYTPKINYTITSCPKAVIVTFENKKWLWGKIVKHDITKNNGAFNEYIVSDQSIIPSLKIGQEITISGKIKKEYGNKGISLSNVKLISINQE